jgi:seryl-tRNA synthetase
MLDTNFIRNNLELVRKKVEAKGVPFAEERFSAMDLRRRQLLARSEELKSRKNKLAKETGFLKKSGAPTRELELQSIEISKQVADGETELATLETDFQEFLLSIPNLFINFFYII